MPSAIARDRKAPFVRENLHACTSHFRSTRWRSHRRPRYASPPRSEPTRAGPRLVTAPPALPRLALLSNGSSSSGPTVIRSAPNTSGRRTTSGWRSSLPPADGATVGAGRPLPVTTLRFEGVALRRFDFRFLDLWIRTWMITTPPDRALLLGLPEDQMIKRRGGRPQQW